MTNFIIIQESQVIKYLFEKKIITNQQKKSMLGMLNEDCNAVQKFIDRTNIFSSFLGDFGCGVDCCGVKINYRLL